MRVENARVDRLIVLHQYCKHKRNGMFIYNTSNNFYLYSAIKSTRFNCSVDFTKNEI